MAYSTYSLEAQTYIEKLKMRDDGTYAGSVELEAAAFLLQTPIKTFAPAAMKTINPTWQTYGKSFELPHRAVKTLYLLYTNNNHFEYVWELHSAC